MTRVRSIRPFSLLFSAFIIEIVGSTTVYGATLENSDFDNYIKVIWGLLIVLGIILLLYALLKKRFSLLHSSTKKEINILEMKPLMGKKALCLVNVRGKDLLLGISDNNISHIASFTASTETKFADVLQASSEAKQP